MNKETFTIDTTQSVTRITTYVVDASNLEEAKAKLQAYLEDGSDKKGIRYYDPPEEECGEETIID
jgi:hypothetical protein